MKLFPFNNLPSASIAWVLHNDTYLSAAPNALSAEEEQLIANSKSAQYQQNFRCGRLAAKRALEKLGVTSFPILRSKAGAPIWPENIVGSISHTDNCACAIVAHNCDLRALGVDIETLTRCPTQAAVDRVLIAEEQKILENYTLAPIAGFSAKEALYKSLFPICKKYFGYEAALLVDVQANELECILYLELQTELHPSLPQNSRYAISLYEHYQLLLALSSLPA